ncbi:MAG: 1,2-phenylacetyl-CoA epoxidase subunit PaaC [Saprospiraceae bacterium]
MDIQKALFDYTLRLGDNALILGHRLSEWCGRGPILEQDIAMTNIALDLIGQARSLLQYAGEIEGKGRTEDDLAFLRDISAYRNVLLVEQPNEDFAFTMVRQFFYDNYSFHFYTALLKSTDKTLAAIAEKSLKEVRYHLRYSSEWMIRLGDGTEESNQKMQKALNQMWMYQGELLTMNETDRALAAEGIGVDLEALKPAFDAKLAEILTEATLEMPTGTWMQKGGKEGKHSEHLGFILAEMQYLQRAHPGATW